MEKQSRNALIYCMHTGHRRCEIRLFCVFSVKLCFINVFISVFIRVLGAAAPTQCEMFNLSLLPFNNNIDRSYFRSQQMEHMKSICVNTIEKRLIVIK